MLAGPVFGDPLLASTVDLSEKPWNISQPEISCFYSPCTYSASRQSWKSSSQILMGFTAGLVAGDWSKVCKLWLTFFELNYASYLYCGLDGNYFSNCFFTISSSCCVGLWTWRICPNLFYLFVHIRTSLSTADYCILCKSIMSNFAKLTLKSTLAEKNHVKTFVKRTIESVAPYSFIVVALVEILQCITGWDCPYCLFSWLQITWALTL